MSVCTLDNEIVSKKDIHIHLPDEAEVEAKKLVYAIKEKVRDTARPILAIYTEEIQAIASRSD